MKAKAPEKIWIDPTTDLSKLSGHIDKDSIEYTRTNVLIDKAVSYILSHKPDMHILGDSCTMDELIIKDFIKYMKGE